MRRKCKVCGIKTFCWEKIGSLIRCWQCGARSRSLVSHIIRRPKAHGS